MSKLDDNDYSTDGLTLFSVSKRYTNVIISSKCETIFGESSSDYAFNHVNDILESFSFEDNPNLANINKFSFYNCIQLRSVNLSPCTKLKTIGDSAFQDCSSLETIILPEGLTTIGSFMISQTKISSINIPSTVTTIINFGLGRTPYLRTVTFTKGSQLKSITGNNFFYTNMKTFTVPENVDFFDGMAFSWSYTLETIIVDPDNPYLFSDGKALYNKNLTKIYFCAQNCGENYTIIPTVTTIGNGCFCFSSVSSFSSTNFVSESGAIYSSDKRRMHIYPPASKRSYFYLLEGVTSVEDSAFMGCINLRSVLLPEFSLIHIGRSSFQGCSNLRQITIPSSVTSVDTDAFKDCPLLVCGVLIQNDKNKTFVDILRNSGLSIGSTSFCSGFSCKANLYLTNKVPLSSISVFILM